MAFFGSSQNLVPLPANLKAIFCVMGLKIGNYQLYFSSGCAAYSIDFLTNENRILTLKFYGSFCTAHALIVIHHQCTKELRERIKAF